MNTISLSALILISVPFQVLAQDNEANSYFVKSPVQFEQTANHITQSQPQSTRKGNAPQLKAPVVVASLKAAEVAPTIQKITKLRPIEEFNFEVPQVSPSDYVLSRDTLIPGTNRDALPKIVQASKLQEISGGDFKPLQIATKPISQNNIRVALNPRLQQVQTIQSEAFPGLNDVVKPSPQNTFKIAEPNQQVVESVPPSPVGAEAVSLDHLRMSQRAESWEEKPNMMRDTVDHFSPGGEPFAFRGVAGEPNFFGVDRHACCDEWSGLCNCSGGLKTNPGHLGNPFLRGKENCETAKKVFGNHRARKVEKSCGCPNCSN